MVRTSTHAAGVARLRDVVPRGSLDGLHHRSARRVHPTLIYEAVGLPLPLIGGAVAYLLLRREFGPMKTVRDAGDGPNHGAGHPVTTCVTVR